ncbi:uncharacterized protein LOC123917878 [Trifolium pratense]|uniref:uncharacterized protein LOC123917878 n=1 Tax=Trifolium pratense TaxID=57577 RepID=UPI001E696A76|nr:uncharacterized protein LOC123917878 [Trifolium pratense]
MNLKKKSESRKPLAFAPKVIPSADSVTEVLIDPNKTPTSARHKRGCNCKKSNLQTLILEVPGTNSSKVHLRYPTNTSENVQIVGGWKNFCFDNGIQFGDRLRIEFKHVYPNVGKVFKVTT